MAAAAAGGVPAPNEEWDVAVRAGERVDLEALLCPAGPGRWQPWQDAQPQSPPPPPPAFEPGGVERGAGGEPGYPPARGVTGWQWLVWWFGCALGCRRRSGGSRRHSARWSPCHARRRRGACGGRARRGSAESTGPRGPAKRARISDCYCAGLARGAAGAGPAVTAGPPSRTETVTAGLPRGTARRCWPGISTGGSWS